jgi:hypothetical protein
MPPMVIPQICGLTETLCQRYSYIWIQSYFAITRLAMKSLQLEYNAVIERISSKSQKTDVRAQYDTV